MKRINYKSINNNKEEKEKPKSHGAFKRAVIKAALRNIIEKSSKS